MNWKKFLYNRTANQWKNKIDNLKAIYKKIKNAINETGRARKSFKHFALTDGVLVINQAIHHLFFNIKHGIIQLKV